jgi:hypothetical protein
LYEVDIEPNALPAVPSPTRPAKRPRQVIEIGDSEDEFDSDAEFGWAGEDELAAEAVADGQTTASAPKDST